MSEETKKTTVNAEAVEEKKHTHKDGSTHSHAEHTHHESKSEEKKTAESSSYSFEQFTDSLDKFFNKQAPSLPTNVKEFLVKYIPYFSIVGLVFGVIGGLFGLIVLLAALLSGQIFLVISIVLSYITLVLSALAIPGLFAKKKQGWVYNYYACIVSILSSLFAGSILGVVLGGLIGGYFLFQLRSYYK